MDDATNKSLQANEAVATDLTGATPRMTKNRWILAGFEALARGGVGAVRVEVLARGLGLTKGAFYHHFANRQALLDAMLESWRDASTEAVIDVVGQERSPRARFAALVEVIFSPKESEPIESAMRAWAANSDEARVVAGEVDQRRLGFVAAIFVDAGMPAELVQMRAEAFYRLVIGNFMWLSTGGVEASATAREDLIVLFMGELQAQ